MTKKKRIILWSVLGGVALILIICIFCADAIVTSIADKELKEALSKNDKVQLSYDKLHVLLMSGTVTLSDIEATIPSPDTLSKVKAEQIIKIQNLDIRGINWLKLRKKELNIMEITIKSPQAQIVLPPKELKKKKKDSKAGLVADTLQHADSTAANPFKISVGRIKLKNGSLALTRIGDKFSISADSLNLKVYDLGYDVAEKQMAYNDSLYNVSLNNFNMLSSDGLFQLTVGQLSTADAGAVNIKDIHALNTCKQQSLAKLMGKIPVTWVDAVIPEITTSEFNLVRQIVQKNIDIQNIDVKGKRVVIYRDTQYPPKVPFGMPQEDIMNIPVPVSVNNIHVTLPNFTAYVTEDGTHAGVMPLNHLNINMNSFNNKHGNTLASQINGKLGESKLNINLSLHNDKACTFDYSFYSEDISSDILNGFIHPLSGTSLYANFHSIDIKTKGNKQANRGTFCMIYDSLSMHITKEDAPERLAKNAGVINAFAPAVIQKQNPRSHGKDPFVAEIDLPRNPQKNFVTYVIDPLTDGIMHSAFPEGIYQSIRKSMYGDSSSQAKKK